MQGPEIIGGMTRRWMCCVVPQVLPSHVMADISNKILTAGEGANRRPEGAPATGDEALRPWEHWNGPDWGQAGADLLETRLMASCTPSQ